MEREFDLIVIGTGAAGSTAAYKCRKAGWEVAIIDSMPFGGTCALRGCDPKKVLVSAAELIDWHRRMEAKGVSSQGVEIDWSALMHFKKTFTEPVPKNREEGYAKAGIAALHGRTRFLDRRQSGWAMTGSLGALSTSPPELSQPRLASPARNI